MDLNQIYAPVSDDLLKVEETIRSVSMVDFSWLSQLLKHSLGTGGKRIRPALTLLAGKFHDYQLKYLSPMATAIELMHTATLIHDDAIDKSDIRRGKPTIYKLWGTDAAVLLGDYLFAKAGVCSTETQNIRTIKLFSETLMIISRGELNQGINAFNLNQSREDYFKRIYGKTASLFCLSTESGAVLSSSPEDVVQSLKQYGYHLGIAFQIVDDILDFTATEAELGKPAGSDLSQGTFTLPAMMLNERYPGNNPVKSLFETRDFRYINPAIEQIRDSSIVDDCYKIARQYCDNACHQIRQLPDNIYHQSLTELADFVVTRKS